MALQKTPVELNFDQGIDTKSDPNKVALGKLLMLQNAVFDNGALNKRNGFGLVSTLPDVTSTTLATLNGNLLAVGTSLQAYSAQTDSWLNRGTMLPVDVSTTALVRTATAQSNVDMAVTAAGITCTVWLDNGQNYYQVSDGSNGQKLTSAVALPSAAKSPRVRILGNSFVITFIANVAATPHLRFIAVPINSPLTPSTANDIATTIASTSSAYDTYVANNILFVAWNASDSGGAVRIATLSSTLIVGVARVISGKTANLISLTADTANNTLVIWLSFFDGADSYSTAYSQTLISVLAPTKFLAATVINQLTSTAANGLCSLLYQVTNSYSFASVRTDYVSKSSVTQTGVVTVTAVVLRSVGLASRAFTYNSQQYFLAAYGQALQPTYFLCDSNSNIVAKLAYANGGGYISGQVLPQVTVNGSNAIVPYLYKSALVSVNKSQGVAAVAGIYAPTGVNVATFSINKVIQQTSEIGGSLHLTGGYLYQYDGSKPVEHGFHVYPDSAAANTNVSGGALAAQQYYYQFCYEWTDAAGLLHRSAPSAPAGVVTTGAASTNTLNVPTLRLTAKFGANPVRIVGYRWSTSQQSYYQFTSINNPVINDVTIDSVSISDGLADSAILGNSLLYTTGGVVEDIAAPACSTSTLFKTRLWLVSAEDRNLLWFSKQTIKATPVEFSDLLTLYVPPTIGAQGSTGKITALSAMDDKLIIFKSNAIYYVTGIGPDNTGASNDFSDPVFITATVGCINPNGIVMTPVGLMFQSDKGIWLLHRNLSTMYVGADVENYNAFTVLSSLAVPGTNQVRFTLNNGITLLYDYFFGQWATFTGIPGISSSIYNGKHTYLTNSGQVRQETPGLYLDGNNPVLLRFTTAWIKLTNLQGYQRAYSFYLLANYFSPHKLQVQVSYNFNPAVTQTTILTPSNSNTVWGSDTLYGSAALYGGSSNIENFRVYLQQQKCESIQITLTELFDSTPGLPAGLGFTLSGISVVIGAKLGFPKRPSSQSAG